MQEIQNILLDNGVTIRSSLSDSSIHRYCSFDDELDLVLKENSLSRQTTVSTLRNGRAFSTSRLFQWVYRLVQETKAARILSHLDQVREREIVSTLGDVAKQLSVAYEYQLVMLQGETEVHRLAEHGVTCIMTYLNTPQATFEVQSLLLAILEEKPSTSNSSERLKTRELSFRGNTFSCLWKLSRIFKHPGLRVLVKTSMSVANKSEHKNQSNTDKDVALEDLESGVETEEDGEERGQLNGSFSEDDQADKGKNAGFADVHIRIENYTRCYEETKGAIDFADCARSKSTSSNSTSPSRQKFSEEDDDDHKNHKEPITGADLPHRSFLPIMNERQRHSTNSNSSQSNRHSHSNISVLQQDEITFKDFKFCGCFTPYGARCQPSRYGYRGPLYALDETGSYEMLYNDQVTMKKEHTHSEKLPQNVHQSYIPKTLFVV